MAKCEKCGAELAASDVYQVNDKEYCEDCAMTMQSNPGRRCGE